MAYFFILWFQLQFSLIFQNLKDEKAVKVIGFIAALLFFYVFTIGVRDTADWHNYQFVFENQDYETKDFLIRYISDVVSSSGGSYEWVYILHLSLTGLFLTIFAKSFSTNPFLVITIYLVLNYVPLVNQIRYFLAFSLYLLALKQLVFRKNKPLALLLSILAFVSHSAILLLYPVVFFLNIHDPTKLFRYLFAVSATFFVFIYLAYRLGYGAEFLGFSKYFADKMQSSFLGGAVKCIPFVISLYLIFRVAATRLKENPSLMFNNLFRFIYVLSFFPLVFIPAAFMLQILGDRYVFSFLIVWVCFYAYLVSMNKDKQALTTNLLLLFLYSVFIFSWVHFLPMLIFQSSPIHDEMMKSLKSISYLSTLF